jgi:hypothetical protein
MHAPAAKLAQLGLLVLLALVLVPLTGVTVSTLHAGQPAEIAFDIPAQSLASALTEVGAQAPSLTVCQGTVGSASAPTPSFLPPSF